MCAVWSRAATQGVVALRRVPVLGGQPQHQVLPPADAADHSSTANRKVTAPGVSGRISVSVAVCQVAAARLLTAIRRARRTGWASADVLRVMVSSPE